MLQAPQTFVASAWRRPQFNGSITSHAQQFLLTQLHAFPPPYPNYHCPSIQVQVMRSTASKTVDAHVNDGSQIMRVVELFPSKIIGSW